MTMQIAFQLVSDLIPTSVIGQINRDSSILELSPTITALVLAGKVGSSISSQIGSMRVTEQIDALEIMGINAPGYLDRKRTRLNSSHYCATRMPAFTLKK